MAADLRELPGWARDLLAHAPVGHLSYLDDQDRPRVLPVTFAVAGEELWTAIDQKPKRKPPDQVARVRYLRRRPRAALCADHYEDDWTRLAWVQVMASVEVVEAGTVQSALTGLQAKYPHYVDDPPDGPFLRLRPERVLCWRASED
jgi:PPOX class probable F420-dependent enzyme